VGKRLPASDSCRQLHPGRFERARTMSSILPKGIVVNTAEISGDIEKIDREPLAVDEIAKLWKGESAIAARAHG
jgi:hypothetical protein